MGGRTKDDIIRTKNERLQNKLNPSKHRHKKDRKEKQKSSIVNIVCPSAFVMKVSSKRVYQTPKRGHKKDPVPSHARSEKITSKYFTQATPRSA